MATVGVSSVQVTGLAARVTVTVTGAVGGSTMSVLRVAGGVESPVLGATDVPAESTVFDDPEIDLNTSTTWRVVLSTGETGTSAARTISNTLPVLSDPYSGVFVEVVILDLGDEEATQRGKALDIEETDEVVYVYDVESAPRRPISLLTLTDAARDTLLELVRAGGPLLLRSACSVHRVGWFARDGGSRRLSRLSSRAADPRHTHTFGQTVRVPVPLPGVRPAGDTLGDLDAAAEPATLGGIAARWATLGDIAAADLRGA